MNEYGAKLDLVDSRLVATASYFEIEIDNNLGSGPTLNGTPTTILLGPVSTKGWEADLAYQPLDTLTFMVGLSDMDSKTSTGIRQNNVPQGLSYRALGKYTFTHGPLKNLMAGLGYEYTNERAGDAGDTFNLPAYGVWNAFAGYRLGDWRIQVNVDNLTDEVYAQSSPQRTLVYAGEPRSFKFTVGYRF
jgi:iron complex outermembrane receptor protein